MNALVPSSQQDYVAAIWARWLASVENILAVGAMLIDAKRDLPHGEFTEMIEKQLPFKERTGQTLMQIARNHVLTNPQHVALLPPSWGTLYELSRLPEPTLQKAIEAGTVTPALERHEVRALWPDAPNRDIGRSSVPILCSYCLQPTLRRIKSEPADNAEIRVYECTDCGPEHTTKTREAWWGSGKSEKRYGGGA